MIKTRIIPILLLKGSSIVKTVNFKEPRMVGDAITNVKVFSSRLADEMAIVDIEATRRGRINHQLIQRLASLCVMPLSIGGGISSLNDAEMLFKSGADKVVINSAFYSEPDLLSKVADKYGAQSVVFSLDVKKVDSSYIAVSHSGIKFHNEAIEAALEAVNSGAGEIILNSIDQDGTMGGFDLELINAITSEIKVPVIAAGGCGNKADFVSAVDSGAAAVAAGSIFYWVGESIITIKEFMSKNGIEVRFA